MSAPRRGERRWWHFDPSLAEESDPHHAHVSALGEFLWHEHPRGWRPHDHESYYRDGSWKLVEEAASL